MSATSTPAPDGDARSRELRELIARCGLGDRAAFSTLYQRTSAQLFGVVLRIQRDRAVAEDVLQDVYVNLWKGAGSFDAARSQPMTWMTSVARHRAIDSLRQAQARPSTLSLSPDEDDDSPTGPPLQDRLRDPGAGPADLLEHASQARELSRCMQGLSAAQRQCVALAFFDGLSHAEVADHLQQPLGTVKSWVRRALQGLKACLEQAVRREALLDGFPPARAGADRRTGA